MKTKIITCSIIALSAIMCSFVIYKGEKSAAFKVKTITAANSAVLNANINSEADAWTVVSEFVEKQIVVPIEKAEKKKNGGKANKIEYFSRCPSGIESNITSDTVKVDRYVYGKVNNWRGCQAKGICAFRVNVKNNVVQVKDIGTKVYFSVSEWIEKKYPKEIKG